MEKGEDFRWKEEEMQEMRAVAYSYIRQGVYDVALTFFDALAVAAPPSVYDLQTLGALHLQIGNALKALDHLDRALKAAPDHLPTQLNRAKALFMLGYKKQGIAAVMALAKNSSPTIAQEAEALLLAFQ